MLVNTLALGTKRGMSSRPSRITDMKSSTAQPISSEERKFLREMIEHHQMAVYMSQNILRSVSNHDVEYLAYDIIRNQVNEINLMKQLLN